MSDWTDNPNVTEQTRNAVEWGKRLERERILNVIMEERCDCSEDCDRIDTHLEYLLDRIKNV